MRRRYSNPPVIEAICEFRLIASQPWDLTIPGLLFKEIQSDFPIVEQSTTVSVNFGVSGNETTTQQQPSVRFLSADRTEVIQVAPNLLSIHQLKPYRSWESYRARIIRVLTAYTEIAHIDGLSRIALRYMDSIELPSTITDLEDYFLILPQVPKTIPQVFQSFLSQVLILVGNDHQNPESRLRLAFGTVAPEKPDTFAFLLDLETFSEGEKAPDVNNVLGWLDAAHDRVEDAFDAAFTAKTHTEIFGEHEP